MARDSFVFYRSYYDAISCLGPEEQLSMYRAIVLYGLKGILPDRNTLGHNYAVFVACRVFIDKAAAKYEARVKRAEAWKAHKAEEREGGVNNGKSENGCAKCD